MDGRKDRVCIKSLAAIFNVDVGVDVAAHPEALKEAQDARSAGRAVGAGLSEFLRKCRSLDKSTVRS